MPQGSILYVRYIPATAGQCQGGEAEGRATVAGEGGRPQSAAAERHTGGALTLGCQTEAASVRWHPITMMGGGTAAARGRSAP